MDDTMIPSSQEINNNVLGATRAEAAGGGAASEEEDDEEKFLFWKMAKKICSQKKREQRSAAMKAYRSSLEPTIVPTEILWPSSVDGGGGSSSVTGTASDTAATACSSIGGGRTGGGGGPTGTGDGAEAMFDLGNLLLRPSTKTTKETMQTTLYPTATDLVGDLSDMEDNGGDDEDDAGSCVSDVTRELPDIDAPTLYPSLDFLDVELPDLSVKEKEAGKLEVTSTAPITSNLNHQDDDDDNSDVFEMYPSIHCMAEEPLTIAAIFGDDDDENDNNNDVSNSLNVLSNCKPSKSRLDVDSATGSISSRSNKYKALLKKQENATIDMEELDNLLDLHMSNLTVKNETQDHLQHSNRTTGRATSSSPTPQRLPRNERRTNNRAQSSSPVPPLRVGDSQPSSKVLPKFDYRRTVSETSPTRPRPRETNYRRTKSEASPAVPQRRESNASKHMPMPMPIPNNNRWALSDNTPIATTTTKGRELQAVNSFSKPHIRRTTSESSPVAPQRRESCASNQMEEGSYYYRWNQKESSPILPKVTESQATKITSEEEEVIPMPSHNRHSSESGTPTLPIRRASQAPKAAVLQTPRSNRAISGSGSSPTLPTRRGSQATNSSGVVPMPRYNRAISSETCPSLPKRRLSLDSQRDDTNMSCSIDSNRLSLKEEDHDDDDEVKSASTPNGPLLTTMQSRRRASDFSAPMPPQRRLSLDSRMSGVDDQTYIPTREELGYEDISVYGRPQVRQSDEKKKSKKADAPQTTTSLRQDNMPPGETECYDSTQQHGVHSIKSINSNAYSYRTPNQSFRSSGHDTSKQVWTPRSSRWEPEALAPAQEHHSHQETDDYHCGELLIPNARLPFRRNSFSSLMSNDSTIATWTLGLYRRRKSADSTVAEPIVPGWAVPDSTPSQPKRRLTASSLLREQLAATESQWNCVSSIDESRDINRYSITAHTVSTLGFSSGPHLGISSRVSRNGGRQSQKSPHLRKSLRSAANGAAPGDQEQQQFEPEENAPEQVEIQPGLFLPLRGSEETSEAVQRDFVERTSCMECGIKLVCISDAHYVLCPLCKEVSPVLANLGSRSGGGVGLGMEVSDPLLSFTKLSTNPELCAARPA